MSERLPRSVWRFQSATRANVVHTVTLGANRVLTCTCEGWGFTKVGHPKECTHIKQVGRDEGFVREVDGEYVYGMLPCR